MYARRQDDTARPRLARCLARRRRYAGDAGRILANGEEQVRLVRPPAVADAEIDRRRALAEKLGELGLVGVGEDAERLDVAAERLETPFLAIEIRERDAGVVLEQRGAVGDQEFTHLGEAVTVHQVGRALDQAVARRELVAELHEAAAREAVVGQIGAEV